MRHAFTVDVEDWYQGIPISTKMSAQSEPRLERSCHHLLDIMAEHGVRGTFFILGPVAQQYPDLIRRIAREGHELGCHGWSHDLVYENDARAIQGRNTTGFCRNLRCPPRNP